MLLLKEETNNYCMSVNELENASFQKNKDHHIKKIKLNEELFEPYQQMFMSSLKPSGHVVGTGRCKLLLPTPQMIAEESTSCMIDTMKF